MAKTQTIRLVDVFLLGPFLILAALWRRPPAAVRLGVAFAGVATIVFNGVNWLRINRGRLGITRGR